MKKIFLILPFLFFLNCSKSEQIHTIANLPKKLEEVSGIATVKGSNLLWMHNDSGNKNKVYGVTLKGRIEKTVEVKAKNVDWEDVTSDKEGNLYIGDFGNNNNTRKDLVILKIKNKDLLTKRTVEVEKIKFRYPNQYKFPPKKKDRFFDAESVFYSNGNLYIFTKSRVKKAYGKTRLYKIPAQKGTYVAKFIAEFSSCNKPSCRITASAISPNGKKVALLSPSKILLFTNFSSDNFLDGTIKELNLGFTSQKEAITFKDNNTLYITDEKAHGKGGKLYVYKL